MIEKADICRCCACGHRWLPQATKENPKAQAKRVPRCASCKTRRWNDDDPRVKSEKEKKAQALTPQQAAKAKRTIAQARKAEPQRPAPSGPGVLRRLCKHRIVAATCPICRGNA